MIVPEAEFDIDAVRAEWVGRKLGRSAGRYPVEFDPIRRYCHMTGDLNPLYLDPVAAAAGPFGAVIVPPAFVRYFALPGPWPPADGAASNLPTQVPRLGDRAVNLETRWEFLAPVRVGERLHADWRVSDVFVKPTRLDPKSVWIATEALISTDADEPVARWRNTVLYHRPPGSPSATGVPPAPAPARPAAARSAAARPAAARPAAARPAAAAVGGESIGTLEIEVTPTVQALQVSGTQDWNPVHHDLDYARAGGHALTFLNTGWTQAILARLITDWIGDRGWLATLAFQMRQTNRLGDRVRAEGFITRREPDADGRELVGLEVWLSNPRVGVSTPGTASVRLSGR